MASSDEDLAGIPLMIRGQQAVPQAADTVLPRDNEAGIPVQIPKQVVVVAGNSLPAASRYRPKDAVPAEGQAAAFIRALVANANVIAFVALALISVGFFLFIASHAIPLVIAIGTLSTPFRIAGYIGLAMIAVIIVYCCLRLVWLYWRFRRNQQLAMEEFEAVDERLETCQLTQQLQAEGIDRLQDYLKSYPIEDSQGVVLVRNGCSEEGWKRLKNNRQRLMSGPDRTTRRSWLEDYARTFQSQLDSAAVGTIREYAVLAGTRTALSPNALIDSLILIHCGFGMFGNLCAIYHLKLGTLATAKFIGWVFAQAYLGGKLEELSDNIEEQIEDELAQAFQTLGLVAMGPLAAMLGSAAGKASQGFANAMLMNRLGKHAMRSLRPVRGV